MRHIYENRSGKVHRLFLITENKVGGNQMVFVPGSKIELSYPGLDVYVPHLLVKVSEQGFNISAGVEAERRSRLPISKSEDQTPDTNLKSSEPVSASVKVAAPVEEVVKEVLPEKEVAPIPEKEVIPPPVKESKHSKKSFFKNK